MLLQPKSGGEQGSDRTEDAWTWGPGHPHDGSAVAALSCGTGDAQGCAQHHRMATAALSAGLCLSALYTTPRCG